MPEQAAEPEVEDGILRKREADPVAARLKLAALTGPALRLGHRLTEAFRARGAEIDGQDAPAHDHPDGRRLPRPRPSSGASGVSAPVRLLLHGLGCGVTGGRS